MEHKQFPPIESLRHACKKAELYGVKKITYKAKIKLHGTNAAIRCDFNGKITCQSRSQDITPESDNAGFARHVHENDIETKMLVPMNTIVFGEWCGPGIQKGTAINQIGQKIFAVFSVLAQTPGGKFARINDPEEIDHTLGVIPEWVHILPWHGDEVEIDFSNPEPAAKKLEEMLTAVEVCDPWVKAAFGIEGTGEGLVLYPQDESFSKFSFKVKGEKHKVKSTKQKIEVDPEIAASAEEFAEAFVTPGRMDQCVSELDIELGWQQNIGKVIKWVSQDVLKESTVELQEAGLEWKQVSKAVQSRARMLYMDEGR